MTTLQTVFTIVLSVLISVVITDIRVKCHLDTVESYLDWAISEVKAIVKEYAQANKP